MCDSCVCASCLVLLRYLGSRTASWFNMPTGTTLSTQFFATTLSSLNFFFARFHTSLCSTIEAVLVHANQFMHRRRQCSYRAVHFSKRACLPDAVNRFKKSYGTTVSTQITVNHHPKNHVGRLCRPRSFNSLAQSLRKKSSPVARLSTCIAAGHMHKEHYRRYCVSCSQPQ